MAQGSVLGPLLWNISYDEAPRLGVPPRVTLVGFADDMTAVVMAKEEDQLKAKVNETPEIIWGVDGEKRPEMVPEKTEALIVRGRRKYSENLFFTVQDKKITPQDTLVSLGITWDKNLNYKAHLQKTAAKAGKIQTALQRLMPNIKEPKTNKKRLLSSEMHSVMLYGAPI